MSSQHALPPAPATCRCEGAIAILLIRCSSPGAAPFLAPSTSMDMVLGTCSGNAFNSAASRVVGSIICLGAGGVCVTTFVSDTADGATFVSDTADGGTATGGSLHKGLIPPFCVINNDLAPTRYAFVFGGSLFAMCFSTTAGGCLTTRLGSAPIGRPLAFFWSGTTAGGGLGFCRGRVITEIPAGITDFALNAIVVFGVAAAFVGDSWADDASPSLADEDADALASGTALTGVSRMARLSMS